MKKFLSLVLALAMTLSLVTISAGAKDFADSDELTSEQYEEAVNVMSEMGIIDGYSDGDFRPQGTLTRQAAAKIIACMMLGKTTAESLGTQAAPFKDVPAGSQFAGYIAFCVERGLIDGYADGTFRPTGTLTGFAFLKMLLGALGYDSSIEGYTGTNWTVNVAGRAYEIGLTDGNEEFVGSRAATREEAALYAVNTLKATLVEYADKGSSITINGAEIVTGASEPTYVTSSVYNAASSISADRDNEGMYTVEFAERYQPDLKLTPDTDDFERPAHTWSWKSREIGTYMNYDELVAEYTTGVTGREMYNVLTSTTIRDYSLDSFVDGGEGDVVKGLLVRSNEKDLPDTGNGVLTQVFVDNEDEEIVITSINTYLAQATADYNSRQERLSLDVYTAKTSVSKTVDLEDVPGIEDVEEDQFVLVNMSEKDSNTLQVVNVLDAEVMEDSTVTKWSSDEDLVVSKLTTGGTQYDAAEKAYYDAKTLEKYDDQLLTDMSYNIYLDQYGYVIGVDLYEGTLNYVFITGYDLNKSNISVRTADAAAIFTDGSMKEITVDVKDTNNNIIDKGEKNYNAYYNDWTSNDTNNGDPAVNRWYSYTVDSNGVYTLKPVDMIASAFEKDEVINCANVRLDGIKGTDYPYARAYGNDDSIYITVDVDAVDTKKEGVITEVSGTYTGVQEVEIELYAEGSADVGAVARSVYTVYDDDQYIIASIVLGEARGNVANYAYILSAAKSEELRDGTYYWEFDAILNGEVVTLTAMDEYNLFDRTDVQNIKDALNDAGDKDNDVLELRFSGDYVVDVDTVTDDNIYTGPKDTEEIEDCDIYDVKVENTTYGKDGTATTADGEELVLAGRTLYSNVDDEGLTIVSDAKAVVIQNENGEEVTEEYGSVREAMSALADADEDAKGLQYNGRIVAVLNDQGVAEWVVFCSYTDVETGAQDDDTTDSGDVRLVSFNAALREINLRATKGYDPDDVIDIVKVALTDNGYIWTVVEESTDAGEGAKNGYLVKAYPTEAGDASREFVFTVNIVER